MGTEIQAKTYFSGSYSTRDLNDSAGSSIWSLYHDHDSLKNGQNYDSFTISPAIDGFLGYGKDRLRQTILNHDSVFRHQLSELHRLYKRQRDLMNEIKRRELHQHSVPAERLQSSLFLSYTAFEDHKRTRHVSDFPFMDPKFSKHLTSGADSVQLPPSCMGGKNISNLFRSHERVTSKDQDSPESKCKLFQTRLLNAELPIDVYTDNKGKWIEESPCGVSKKESCPPNRNCEVTCEKDVNLSTGNGLSSGGIEDALRYNLCSRKTGVIIDLNEPIQAKEASVSASADNLGNIKCFLEELRMQPISVTSKSGFHILSNESSQSSIIGRNGGILLNNVNLDHEGNHTKSLSYKNEAGQSGCCTFRGVVCREDLPAPSKSLQVEHSKVNKSSSIFPSDDSNKEPQRKGQSFVWKFLKEIRISPLWLLKCPVCAD